MHCCVILNSSLYYSSTSKVRYIHLYSITIIAFYIVESTLGAFFLSRLAPVSGVLLLCKSQNVFHPRTPPRTLDDSWREYPRRRSLYLPSPLRSGEHRDVARCSTLSARGPALAPPGLRPRRAFQIAHDNSTRPTPLFEPNEIYLPPPSTAHARAASSSSACIRAISSSVGWSSGPSGAGRSTTCQTVGGAARVLGCHAPKGAMHPC